MQGNHLSIIYDYKYKNHFEKGCRDGKLVMMIYSNEALSLVQWYIVNDHM